MITSSYGAGSGKFKVHVPTGVRGISAPTGVHSFQTGSNSSGTSSQKGLRGSETKPAKAKTKGGPASLLVLKYRRYLHEAGREIKQFFADDPHPEADAPLPPPPLPVAAVDASAADCASLEVSSSETVDPQLTPVKTVVSKSKVVRLPTAAEEAEMQRRCEAKRLLRFHLALTLTRNCHNFTRFFGGAKEGHRCALEEGERRGCGCEGCASSSAKGCR